MGGEVYGWLAEFSSPEAFLQGCRKVEAEGLTRWDAFSPFPLHEIFHLRKWDEQRDDVAVVGLIGGTVGLLGALALQYYGTNVLYPLNIGGRENPPWPAFVPIAFELTILVASLAMSLYMILRNNLSQLYHPLFHVEAFRRASQDRFFICIESGDPLFEREKTRSFLESLGPLGVYEVPAW